MNYSAAQTCLSRAQTHRDVARWLTQRGHHNAARTMRHQMRTAAKQMVEHLQAPRLDHSDTHSRPDSRPSANHPEQVPPQRDASKGIP